MRVHPSKRAFLRRYPAPPATPEGMLYDPADSMGRTLIPAEVQQRRCDRRMGNFDSLPRNERRNLMRSD